MKNYLIKYVSKKSIVYFAYLVLLTVLGFFIYSNLAVEKEFVALERIEKALQEKKDIENKDDKDSDGDGLVDWQEFLYHTDPEKADTDNDGFSDGDEVRLQRDPVVFGKGNNEGIEKVQSVAKNVLTLESQEKERDLIYEKQQGYRDLLQKISKKSEKKLTRADRDFIQSENIRRSKIRKDLNIAGTVLKNNYVDVQELVHDFNNLFMFFSPYVDGGVQKMLKENAGADKNFNIKYEKLEESRLKKIDVLAFTYINISKELERVSIVDENIEIFLSAIGKNYKIMGDNLLFLTGKVRDGDRKVDATEEIKKYMNGLNTNIENRKNIDAFIRVNALKFSGSEAGSIFVYSV